MKNQKIKIASVYIAIFVFYMWLSANTPLTGDDWLWGTTTGIHDFINATQNSRYVGNFVEIIMTRSTVLRIFIMGTVSVLIPFLIADMVVENKDSVLRLFYFILSNTLFLTARALMWSETNGWVAGFANFVISSVFVLLCFRVWSEILNDTLIYRRSGILECLIMFFCSLIGQLFIENIAIVMMILSVIAFGVYYKRTNNISLKYLLMMVGSILGLGIMFSSSIYTSLFQYGEALNGYRQIVFLSNDTFGHMLYSFIYQCARLVVRLGEENLGLTIFILAILIIRLRVHSFAKGSKLLCAFNFLLILYYLFALVLDLRYSSDNFAFAMISAAINGVYLLCVSLSLYRLFRSGDSDAKKALVLWFCALFTLMPLLLTSENGSRLLYTFETLSILMSAMLSYPIIQKHRNNNKKSMRIVALALLVFVCLLPRFLVVYSRNGKCESQRREIIAKALEDNVQTIVLPAFSYKEYAGRATPVSENALRDFKEFYHIPPDVDVIFE